jgi:7,8-dihydropterin-6-yl-methyl-4-(beta-D-ribofuranosyl)aminobenzene 5'-phosphate synthase
MSERKPHLLGDYVFVSGTIPRVTPYETGTPQHITQREPDDPWELDPHLLDERCVAVKVCGVAGGGGGGVCAF